MCAGTVRRQHAKLPCRSPPEDACTFQFSIARGHRLMDFLERNDEAKAWIEAQKKPKVDISTGEDGNAGPRRRCFRTAARLCRPPLALKEQDLGRPLVDHWGIKQCTPRGVWQSHFFKRKHERTVGFLKCQERKIKSHSWLCKGSKKLFSEKNKFATRRLSGKKNKKNQQMSLSNIRN